MAVNDPTSGGSTPNRTPNLSKAPGAAGRVPPASNRPYVRREGARDNVREPIADDAGPLSMTGIRTGVMHSLGMKILLGGLIAIFVGGIGISALTPPGDPAQQAASRPIGGGPDVVARVGEETIPRALFQRSYDNQVQTAQSYGFQDTGAAGLMQIRQTTLSNLAGEAAQVAEAKRRNITASEAEIDKFITDEIDKGLKPQAGETEASVRRRIEGEGTTIDEFKQKQREGFDRELVARAVLLQKLEKAVKDENKVSEDDYKRANTKLTLSQIKISPKLPAPGAKNPEADKAKGEADAKARADKLAAQLKNAGAAQFAAFAKKDSDDIVTKAKGGDLGTKLPAELGLGEEVRSQLVKAQGPFVGPLQDPTSKDFYLFYVAGRKLELPKDYAKKKAELQKQFEETQDSTAWNAFTTKLAEAHKPTIEDPALVAYDIQTKQLPSITDPAAQKSLRDNAIAKYEEALEYAGGSDDTSIRFHLAQLYGAAGQPEKQLATLKPAAENSNDRTVKLEYARALGTAGKKAEAIKLAQEISSDIDKNPSPPPQFSFGGQQNPDDQTRFQIAGLLEQLGSKDLAAKERAKVKPMAPPGMGGMGGMSGMPGGMNGIQMNSGAGSQPIVIGQPKAGGDKKAPASKEAAAPKSAPAAKVNP